MQRMPILGSSGNSRNSTQGGLRLKTRKRSENFTFKKGPLCIMLKFYTLNNYVLEWHARVLKILDLAIPNYVL